MKTMQMTGAEKFVLKSLGDGSVALVTLPRSVADLVVRGYVRARRINPAVVVVEITDAGRKAVA